MNASVVIDETTATREKLEALEQELHDVRRRLDDIPDWLRVGEPTRFRRPADQRTAKQAETLRLRLEEIALEQVRLGVRLDDLDTAASGFPADSTYGVMLPVRLETRFVRPRPGARPGTPEARWRLRVRVEPDAIAMPTPPSPPTRREVGLVERCWNACDGKLSEEAGARAYARLAQHLGHARAAWLLRTVLVDRRKREPGSRPRPGEPMFEAVDNGPAPAGPPQPVVGLPDRLEIWGGAVPELKRLLSLRVNRDAIARQSGLAGAKPKRDRTLPRTWWNSYDAARRVGLAGEITLGEQRPSLEVVLCVGLAGPRQRPTPREVFTAHTRAGRLGTLPPLTPTNTVHGQPAADLRGDPDAWLEMVRLPKTTAGGLSGVLTGAQMFTGVFDPDLSRHRAAGALVRALWPVLWQRSLKDLAGLGDEVYRLGSWAGRHLHPFGPLPVLRVGDLPYGVLPIADFGRMVNRQEPPPFLERAVLRTVTMLSPALVQAAEARPGGIGADEEALLQLLAETPTSREYGSRAYPATLLMAALLAAVTGSDPEETFADWEQRAALLRNLPMNPARRHSPALHVEPFPTHVAAEWQPAVERMLTCHWEQLAGNNDLSGLWRGPDELPPPVLARLVRQSLLLTMAEIGRLGRLQHGPEVALPPRPATYLLPLSDPDQLLPDAMAANEDGPVFEVPGQTAELVTAEAAGVTPEDQQRRRLATVHQFEDVRTAVRELLATDPLTVDSVLTGVLDAAGHRLDVWYTAIAHRRLQQVRAIEATPVLGAYGWVDDVRPSPDPTPPTTAGLIHAPSYSQALTAAVLRDHAVHDAEDDRWKLTLDSASVRLAAELADQVRSGIDLAEVLGRELERRFPEPDKVLALRRKYPARPEWKGRRVCDGQQVLVDARDNPRRLPQWLKPADVKDLLDALDAYADLLVADALHAVVEGRPDAAAESLEASAGLGAPPELRLLRTQREGATITTEVLLSLPYQAAWEKVEITDETSPVEVADPAFARWLAGEVGRPRTLTWTDREHPARRTTLAELGLTVPEALLHPAGALDDLARARLAEDDDDRDLPLGGTARQALARAERLSRLLAGGTDGRLSAEQLRTRLARLRRMATQLQRALARPPAAGPRRRALVARLRRWGLPTDLAHAQEELDARMAFPDDDADVPVAELARRIRRLLPSQVPLALACPQELPGVVARRRLLTDWLPVVAAVRPPLAELEAMVLSAGREWVAGSTDRRADPWAAPAPDRHGVAGDAAVTVVVGPRLPRAGRPTALVRLDAYGETVPAPRHTTWTAFGYDAPRARAPQAVLVVVPADTEEKLDLAQARGAVIQARRLARVRSLSDATPDAVATGVPLGVVETGGRRAATLTEEGG
ncbi:MAG: hypothetical protein ACXWXO_02130 [Nocardioides sp.]